MNNRVLQQFLVRISPPPVTFSLGHCPAETYSQTTFPCVIFPRHDIFPLRLFLVSPRLFGNTFLHSLPG